MSVFDGQPCETGDGLCYSVFAIRAAIFRLSGAAACAVGTPRVISPRLAGNAYFTPR